MARLILVILSTFLENVHPIKKNSNLETATFQKRKCNYISDLSFCPFCFWEFSCVRFLSGASIEIFLNQTQRDDDAHDRHAPSPNQICGVVKYSGFLFQRKDFKQ
jgi:hypothetical protein